ncbi:MAG: hypothetical protein OEZ06_16810 [Myxococcales bacterium]|nr:hypothetical protein [Myxococcales bacterium]
MLNPEHPTSFLRHAWRHTRLDAIRGATESVIRELQELNRQDILPHPGREDTLLPVSASVAALLTCCEELREESGIESTKAVAHTPTTHHDSVWVEAYASQLDRYRTVATRSLRRLLAP